MKTNEPRQLRISLAILYLPIVVFLMAARSVVAAMTGNINFATPFPALPEITTALDDLEAKIAAAVGRDKTAIAVRNAAWRTAKSLIRQLASYVQMHCQNDLGILLSSGFTPTKTPAPVGPLPAPQNPRLTRSEMSGQVRFRFDRVHGMSGGYTVQIGTDPAGPFVDYVTSSKTQVLINDRPPLTTVWARARATGAAGVGAWTEPTSVVAL